MNSRFRRSLLGRWLLALALCVITTLAASKEQPSQTISWPESATAIIRFTFSKFKEVRGLGSQRTYVTDITAENLWSKAIPDATFSLYLFDKNKTRIGEGYITLSNVGAGQTIKFQTTIQSSGSPVSISISARSLPRELGHMAPARRVSITINSVPQGASVKVDGAELGTTPKIAQLTIGSSRGRATL